MLSTIARWANALVYTLFPRATPIPCDPCKGAGWIDVGFELYMRNPDGSYNCEGRSPTEMMCPACIGRGFTRPGLLES